MRMKERPLDLVDKEAHALQDESAKRVAVWTLRDHQVDRDRRQGTQMLSEEFWQRQKAMRYIAVSWTTWLRLKNKNVFFPGRKSLGYVFENWDI